MLCGSDGPCVRLRIGENEAPAVLVQHLALSGRAEHSKVLRQVGRPDRQGVDARDRRDLVEALEGALGLEHDRDVHTRVRSGHVLGRGQRPVLRVRAEAVHAPLAQRSVPAARGHRGRLLRGVDLRDMEIPHAGVEQTRDPLAVALGGPNNQGEVQGAR